MTRNSAHGKDREEASEVCEHEPLLQKSGIEPVRGSPSFRQKAGSPASSALPVLFLAPTLIIVSATLIRFNQHLMQKDQFPYPVVLVFLHTVFCSLFCSALIFMTPSLFPALTDPDRKVDVTFQYYKTQVFPITGFFCVALVSSNMAYKFCTVAFLQMMKESNIVTVYVMSIFVGRETFSLLQILILVMMVMATCLCVKGEMHLSVTGCLLQVASCFCESAKTVTQSLLVSGSGKKLDPLSAVLVVMPVCAAILGSILALHWLQLAAIPGIELPSARDFEKNRWELAANIMIAFVLNVVIAVFLKCSSPITLVLTGNIKDIVIVSMSSMIMREPISRTQCVAFGLQIMLVFLWSALKQNPSWIQPRMLLSSEHKYKGLPT